MEDALLDNIWSDEIQTNKNYDNSKPALRSKNRFSKHARGRKQSDNVLPHLVRSPRLVRPSKTNRCVIVRPLI